MPKISINNTTFYYEIHGTGSPLILISGYTCDHTFWLPILEQLSKQFTVLIFDNRGAGQTVDHGGELSIELLADDVMALADALNFVKPQIVGHSMGGLIAQKIACKYSGRFSKLTILNSSMRLRSAALLGLQSQLLMREKELDFDIIFQVGIPWFYGDDFLKSDQNLQQLKAAVLNNPYPQSLVDQQRQYQALLKYTGEDDLAKIQVPVFIMYGKEDIIVLPYEAKDLADQTNNSILIECDCGHAAIPEVPQQIARLLLDFL